jgi:hypothetical protein
MLYIHDLAVSLAVSDSGAKVSHIACGAVLQADDIALSALTPRGLQSLVFSCETYGKRWRFRYNPVKSKVLIFSNSKRKKQYKKEQCKIKLYDKTVEEVITYTHVGITLDVLHNTTQRSVSAAAKMRSGLMALIGSGVNLNKVSCVTALKLYERIVLPRALYGSELWYKLSKDDVSKLEIAHRFCLKTIQSFPKRTRTVIAQSMINSQSVETHIDYKKLLFVGRLCRLSSCKLAKVIFIERLFQYAGKGDLCRGVACDTFRVLSKYNLIQFLDNFLSQATFPSKQMWRTIVKQAFVNYEQQMLIMSQEDHSLQRFRDVVGYKLHLHPVWLAESRLYGHRKHLRDLAKLNCVPYGNNAVKTCPYCNNQVNDQLDHYFHSCPKYVDTRELYWSLVINMCSVQLSTYLYNLPDEELSAVILGKRPAVPLSDVEVHELLEIGAKSWQLLAHDPELKFY